MIASFRIKVAESLIWLASRALGESGRKRSQELSTFFLDGSDAARLEMIRGVVIELRESAQESIDKFSKAFPSVRGARLDDCTSWERDLRATAASLEIFYGLHD